MLHLRQSSLCQAHLLGISSFKTQMKFIRIQALLRHASRRLRKKTSEAVTVFKAISRVLLSLLISTKIEISKEKWMRHGGILRESSRNFTSTPNLRKVGLWQWQSVLPFGGVWSADSISSFPSSRNMHGNDTTLVAQESLSFFCLRVRHKIIFQTKYVFCQYPWCVYPLHLTGKYDISYW